MRAFMLKGFSALVLSVLLFAGYSYAQSAQAKLNQEALEFAKSFYYYNVTKCGDSYYVRDNGKGFFGVNTIIGILEFKNPKITAHPLTISTADKLNGLEWQGHTQLETTVWRVYDEKGQYWTTKKGWSEWRDGSLTFGVFKSQLFIQKKNHQWLATNLDGRFHAILEKIDCGQIPK